MFQIIQAASAGSFFLIWKYTHIVVAVELLGQLFGHVDVSSLEIFKQISASNLHILQIKDWSSHLPTTLGWFS